MKRPVVAFRAAAALLATAALSCASAPPGADGPLPPGASARLGSPRFRHFFAVTSLAPAPDGGAFAAAGAGIVHWAPRDGRRLDLSANDWVINQIQVDPEGRMLISAGGDGAIRYWDLSERREIWRFLHLGSVLSLALGRRGTALYSVGLDRTLRSWDFANRKGRVLHTLDGRAPETVACPADSDWVLVADSLGGVTIHDAGSGEPRRILRAPEKAWKPGLNATAAASHDGRRVAFQNPDLVLVISDAASGRPLAHVLQPNRILALRFSPDDRRLACALADGNVAVLDARTGAPLSAFTAHVGAVQALAFSRDGEMLMTGGEDAAVRFWSLPSGRPAARNPPMRGHVRALAFAPDGRTVAAGGDDGRLRLWNSAEPAAAPRELDLERPVTRLAWTSDGRRLALGHASGELSVVDVPALRVEAVFGAHENHVRGLAISPDDALIASSGRAGGAVVAHELKSGRLIGEQPVKGASVEGLAYAAGTDLLVGIDDRTFVVWDRRLKARAFLDLDWSRLVDLAASPAGGVVVTALEDHGLKARELASGRPWWTAGTKDEHFSQLAYSPRGRLLAVAREPGHVIALLDAENGRTLRELKRDASASLALAWSPDGRTLAEARGDTTILLWNVPDARELRTAPEEDVDTLWTALARNVAADAQEAADHLVRHGAAAVRMLRDRLALPPFEEVERRDLEKLLRSLDEREVVEEGPEHAALERYGIRAEPLLREARPASKAGRRVLAALLASLDRELPIEDPDVLRRLRALRVLWRIDGPDARELLKALSEKSPSLRERRTAGRYLGMTESMNDR